MSGPPGGRVGAGEGPSEMTGEPFPHAGRSEGAVRVLVADDNAAIRESLSDIIRLRGYQVVEAADGRQALDLVSAGAVDIVLIDLHMPEMDGVTVIQSLPSSPPPIVIVYSAFELFTQDAVTEAVGPRIFRALRKPVAPIQVLTALSEAEAELAHR